MSTMHLRVYVDGKWVPWDGSAPSTTPALLLMDAEGDDSDGSE